MHRRLAIWTALILACAGSSPVAAQSVASASTCQEDGPGGPPDPRRVVVAGGHVSLLPPEGVRRVASDATGHFATGSEPELFMRNEDGSEMVFLSFRNEAARPDTPSYQAARVRDVEAQEGFSGWISRQVVAQGGTRWLRLEYLVRGNGEEKRYRVYYTAFQGRTLLAGFYTRSGSQAVLDRMAAAAASLEWHDCVPAGALAPVVAQRSAAATPACEQSDLRARVLAGGERRVAMADARVSMVPPDGTEERFAREPSQTLHGDRRPLRVYEGDSATVTVMLTDGRAQVDSAAYRDRMRQGIERNVVGLRWIAHDVVEIGGTRWLRLEFTHRQNGGETFSAMYVAPFQGLTLMTGFEGVPRRSPALRQSASTLQVRDCRVRSSMAAWVDSAALARVAATLSAPRLPAEMKPLFLVIFDTDGSVVTAEPVYTQIPADYAAAVTAALRANLKPQPAWREITSHVVRVAGGPTPLVDAPDVTFSMARFPNEDEFTEIFDRITGLVLTPPASWRHGMPETYVQARVAPDGTLDDGSIGFVVRGELQPPGDAIRTVVRKLRVVPVEVDGIGVTTWVVMRPRSRR